MLVRDAANPSTQDTLFPFSRAFDWYHGHSFAKGLFESADSKDQESSSEDGFFSYALKMWGQVIGDRSMEARGNLMLAIQARAFKNYYLMESDNHVQPANFIANKVAGIVSFWQKFLEGIESFQSLIPPGSCLAIREQSRSCDIFWAEQRVYPRNQHESPQSFLGLHPQCALRSRGMGGIL